jgi:hypothetical protein
MSIKGSLVAIALVLALCGFAGTVCGEPATATLAVPREGQAGAEVPAPAAPRAAPSPSAEEIKAAADEFARRYDAADFDPWLWATEAGTGVEAAFRWVRDEVRFESYPGAFRGAKGAYMARAANAADRSLLLAQLLTAKGFPTRFATGRLPADRADALYARTFEPARAAPVAPESAEKQAFARRVAERARRDYAAIRSALGDTMPAASPTREQVLAEIASHVWVQANVDGKWVDLDTAFADAEAGKAYCDAGATSDQLPADLHQRVTVRVVVEQWAGGKLTRAVALEVTKPAADLVGRQVALFHTPEGADKTQGAGAVGGALTRTMGGSADNKGGTGNWEPVLSVGEQPTRGKPIPFDDKTTPPAGKVRKPAPRRGGGFGALGGDTGDEDAADDDSPRFVAEFVEFELTFPGGRKETTRRALSDCAGPAWRAAGPRDPKTLKPLPRDADGPVAPRAVHNIWFSSGRHDLAAFARELTILADAIVPAKAPPEQPAGPGGARQPPPAAGLSMARQLWLLSLQNLPVVMYGDHVLVPALNDDPSIRFYVDSPRILVFTVSAAPGAAGGGPVMETQIDLRRDKVRGVARDAGAASAAAVARRKIWYGALGGALEHEVASMQGAAVAGNIGPEGGAANDAAASSTSALLGREGAVLIRPGPHEGQALKELAAGPDAAKRMAEALADGEALVVPRGAFASASGAEGGYWAVSLATGDTRGVWGPDGHMANMRSPLRHPGPQTYNPRAWIIDEKTLNSRREGGGTEYIGVVNAVAQTTITVLELLYIIGAAIPWIITLYQLFKAL